MSDDVLNTSGEQPTLTREQLMELVADGQRALGQGRADEAIMIAESVLESDDQLPAAWALKGDALERQSRLQEALSCYERVIDLKPDSTLDRIRANHLRKLASTDELEVPTSAPNRRQAALAAVAATVFFILVGSAVVLASQPTSNAATNAGQQEQAGLEANNVHSTFVPQVPVGTGAVTPPVPQAQPQNQEDQSMPGGVYQRYGQGASSRLPDFNNGGGESNDLTPPVTVNPDTRITPIGQPNEAPPHQGGGNGGGSDHRDPDPDVIAQDSGPAKRSDGVIRIGPAEGQGSAATPPTSDGDADMSARTLIQVARDHYVRGDYAKAAAAYERALRAGAESSSTSHRLGDCYRNLGRKAEAITAYERAISGYQAQIDRGANAELAKSGIASCQQAIKILRGG